MSENCNETVYLRRGKYKLIFLSTGMVSMFISLLLPTCNLAAGSSNMGLLPMWFYLFCAPAIIAEGAPYGILDYTSYVVCANTLFIITSAILLAQPKQDLPTIFTKICYGIILILMVFSIILSEFIYEKGAGIGLIIYVLGGSLLGFSAIIHIRQKTINLYFN